MGEFYFTYLVIGCLFCTVDFFKKGKISRWVIIENPKLGTKLISAFTLLSFFSALEFAKYSDSVSLNASISMFLFMTVYYIVVHFLLLRMSEWENKKDELTVKKKEIFLQMLFNNMLMLGFLGGIFFSSFSEQSIVYIITLVLLPVVKEIREAYIENKKLEKEINSKERE